MLEQSPYSKCWIAYVTKMDPTTGQKNVPIIVEKKINDYFYLHSQFDAIERKVNDFFFYVVNLML